MQEAERALCVYQKATHRRNHSQTSGVTDSNTKLAEITARLHRAQKLADNSCKEKSRCASELRERFAAARRRKEQQEGIMQRSRLLRFLQKCEHEKKRQREAWKRLASGTVVMKERHEKSVGRVLGRKEELEGYTEERTRELEESQLRRQLVSQSILVPKLGEDDSMRRRKDRSWRV